MKENDMIYRQDTEKGALEYKMNLNEERRWDYEISFKFPERGEKWLKGFLLKTDEGNICLIPNQDDFSKNFDEYVFQMQLEDGKKPNEYTYKDVMIGLSRDTPLLKNFADWLYEGHENLREFGICYLADPKKREFLYALAKNLGIDKGTAAQFEIDNFKKRIRRINEDPNYIDIDIDIKKLSAPPVPEGRMTGRDLEATINKVAYKNVSAILAEEKAGEPKEKIEENVRFRLTNAMENIFRPRLGGEMKSSDILLDGEIEFQYLDTGLPHARTVALAKISDDALDTGSMYSWRIQYISDLDAELETREMESQAYKFEQENPDRLFEEETHKEQIPEKEFKFGDKITVRPKDSDKEVTGYVTKQAGSFIKIQAGQRTFGFAVNEVEISMAKEKLPQKDESREQKERDTGIER
jgi:hypothetical protein